LEFPVSVNAQQSPNLTIIPNRVSINGQIWIF
jgi:hypothetical protein